MNKIWSNYVSNAPIFFFQIYDTILDSVPGNCLGAVRNV